MAIGPNLPSVEQVLEIAEGFGLELTADEASTYCKLVRGAIKTYRRLDEMVEYRPPVRYPRTPGYRPEAKDNPFNGWYWRCEIDGASEGPLAGKTVGVKDAICVAGVPMMNGSRLLEGFIPDVDATVVTRLLDAGATVLGKTNAEDCSFSGAGHTCALGPVRNPRKRRYIARPAVSSERLSVNDRGQVVYRLKHAFRDGATHVVLDPIEFMRHIRVPHPFGAASGCANRQSCRFGIARLAALVPRLRTHLTRYHGVFAPNCKHRHRIIPDPAHQSPREPHASRPAPMSWMQRLKRVFHIDIEQCGVCGGTLRVIACIETPLKCRSLRELAHSSRRSSPISPRARPAASITLAHRRSMRLSPNPWPAPLRPCPDCTRGCTTLSPLRLASRALRSPAPSRHAFLFAGSKSRHLDRDSCDSSALAPRSNPTTTGPILPQSSQSTPYSSYP